MRVFLSIKIKNRSLINEQLLQKTSNQSAIYSSVVFLSGFPKIKLSRRPIN